MVHELTKAPGVERGKGMVLRSPQIRQEPRSKEVIGKKSRERDRERLRD